MDRNAYALAAYRSARTTVPPLTAIVMLHDSVLVRIHNAAKAAAAHDYETQFNEVMRACEILQSLNACLDMRQGGSVARSLRAFYETTAKALMSSVGRDSATRCCERIAGGVRKMRDAWLEISGAANGDESSAA